MNIPTCLESSLILRNQFAISNPKQVTRHSIGWRLISLGERSGIRKRGQDKNIRQNIMVAHGFRKFFTTQLVNSRANPEMREMLLGHKIGLTGVYYKPSVEEIKQEYEKAINVLTINEDVHSELKNIGQKICQRFSIGLFKVKVSTSL